MALGGTGLLCNGGTQLPRLFGYIFDQEGQKDSLSMEMLRSQ